MNSTRMDSLEMNAVKALNHPQFGRRSSTGATTNETALARFVSDDQTEFLMRQTRVTVGRSSARSAADVDMGYSSFISRNHLEIYLDHNKFFVLVTGKNGIFVDDMFHRKGSPPVELPLLCQLRFPSTEIKLEFESLITPEMALTLPATTNCREVVVDDSSSRDSVVTDEDTNSCMNAYVEESTSDIVDESSICTEVVPISLETEEVWVPSAYHKDATEVIPVPVPDVKATPAVKSVPVLKTAGHGSGRPLVVSKSPRDEAKPPYSYAQLIVQAIMSTVDKQLTLSGIYAYITHNYPYYKASDKGWQNSIRHNLSLNRYFIKVARSQEESGKGSFWRIEPTSEAMLVEQAFRRRRQRSSGVSLSSQYLKAATVGSEHSSQRIKPDAGSAWDEAIENSLIQQTPTVYVSDMPSTTTAMSSQRLQDFTWTSAVKSEFDSGQGTVAKTLSNSNGSRATIYAYPVQSTSQAGSQNITQLPTSGVTAAGPQPPVAILQSALSDNTASWSSGTVFQYITSLTENASVKPGTVFISRPLVPAADDNSKTTLFTNGTELTVANEPETVATASDDLLETSVEDDTTESDTGSTEVNRKRPLDSFEDSAADMPRIKTVHIEADNVASD